MRFRFKLVENFSDNNRLNETHFVKNKSFYDHFDKHVAKNYSEYFLETEDELFEPMSPDQYDQYAHELSQEPIYTSDVDSGHDVVGFISSDGRIIKYRKSLSEIVVYVAKENDRTTISYYKLKTDDNHTRYRRLLSRWFIREYDPIDDYYNYDDDVKEEQNKNYK